jgi:hypothetical protein
VESIKQKILKLAVLGVIVTILGITASVATGIGYPGIGLTVVGVISIVKGSEELIDGNLTDAVINIVNGINAVKQNAPQATQEAKTATGT